MQWCSLQQRTTSLLNNANFKEPVHGLVDHLSEALCLKMGSEGLLSLSANLYPLGLLSGKSLPCSFDNPDQ